VVFYVCAILTCILSIASIGTALAYESRIYSNYNDPNDELVPQKP
jgi:hypothetical protein